MYYDRNGLFLSDFSDFSGASSLKKNMILNGKDPFLKEEKDIVNV